MFIAVKIYLQMYVAKYGEKVQKTIILLLTKNNCHDIIYKLLADVMLFAAIDN